MELATVGDTAKYKNRSSPSIDRLNNGGLARYSLRL